MSRTTLIALGALALAGCAGNNEADEGPGFGRRFAAIAGAAMQARAYQQPYQQAYPAIGPSGLVNPQMPGQQYYYPQQVYIMPRGPAPLPPSPATWHQ